MTRSEWISLAKRCEEATGPDREIDRAIFCAVNGFERIECDPHDSAGPRYYARPVGGEIAPREYENFKPTASLDAITALLERKLPGWYWMAQTRATPLGKDTAEGVVKNRELHLSKAFRGSDVFAYTPALALCAAFCRAMAERAEA